MAKKSEFEARDAGEFSEITFTGTEDVPYSNGDELLPGAVLTEITTDGDPDVVRVQRRQGVQITMKPSSGKFHPKTAQEDAALTAFGLAPAKPEADSKGA